jgi:hypothetical protein
MGNDLLAIIQLARIEAHPQDKDLPVVDVWHG